MPKNANFHARPGFQHHLPRGGPGDFSCIFAMKYLTNGGYLMLKYKNSLYQLKLWQKSQKEIIKKDIGGV